MGDQPLYRFDLGVSVRGRRSDAVRRRLRHPDRHLVADAGRARQDPRPLRLPEVRRSTACRSWCAAAAGRRTCSCATRRATSPRPALLHQEHGPQRDPVRGQLPAGRHVRPDGPRRDPRDAGLAVLRPLGGRLEHLARRAEGERGEPGHSRRAVAPRPPERLHLLPGQRRRRRTPPRRRSTSTRSVPRTGRRRRSRRRVPARRRSSGRRAPRRARTTTRRRATGGRTARRPRATSSSPAVAARCRSCSTAAHGASTPRPARATRSRPRTPSTGSSRRRTRGRSGIPSPPPARRPGRTTSTRACTPSTTSSHAWASTTPRCGTGTAAGRTCASYQRLVQLGEYEIARAQFEAYIGHAKDPANPSTGVIYWMMNKAWPSLQWSLYGSRLRPARRLLRREEGERAAAHPLRVRRRLGQGRQPDQREPGRPARHGELIDLDGTVRKTTTVPVPALTAQDVQTVAERRNRPPASRRRTSPSSRCGAAPRS